MPLPIPRQGLFSSVVGETIYVMGGGFAPGASYSNLNHAYQNTVIPEFEFVICLVLPLSVLAAVAVSKMEKAKTIFPR